MWGWWVIDSISKWKSKINQFVEARTGGLFTYCCFVADWIGYRCIFRRCFWESGSIKQTLSVQRMIVHSYQITRNYYYTTPTDPRPVAVTTAGGWVVQLWRGTGNQQTNLYRINFIDFPSFPPISLRHRKCVRNFIWPTKERTCGERIHRPTTYRWTRPVVIIIYGMVVYCWARGSPFYS